MDDRPLDIDDFEEALRNYRIVEDKADFDFAKALKELRTSINLLESALGHTAEGAKINREMSDWLKQNSATNQLHYETQNCQRLAREMFRIIVEMDQLEKECLTLTKRAEARLARSRELDEKLITLQNRYIQCLYNGEN